MINKQDIDTNTSTLFKEMLKMKRREMTPGNRRRTQSPNITQVRLYPMSQERKYTRYLFDLMDVYSDIATPILRDNMNRWVDEQKIDNVRSDEFNDEFQLMTTELKEVQKDMFEPGGDGVQDDKGNIYSFLTITTALAVLGISVSKHNTKQGDKFTKQVLGVPFTPFEPWLEDVMDIWTLRNHDLINSLTTEYIKKVNFIVPEGIVNGDTVQKIMSDFRKMDTNMTRSRARLLARDQVGKLNGRLTKRRNQELGLDLYRWMTAQDERVRSKHKVLHGKIMRWDDNSVYADSIADARAGNWKSRSSIKGYIGIPGQDIQCRCTSQAVFDEIIEGIDNEIRKEKIESGEIAPSVRKKSTKKKGKEPTKTKTEKLREELRIKKAQTIKAREQLSKTQQSVKNTKVELQKIRKEIQENGAIASQLETRIGEVKQELNSVNKEIASLERELKRGED